MKKVGKYLIITLLLLLGLCCVGILYLFFIPNSELFNITYIGKSQTIKSKEYEVENISTIAINSRSYDVFVVETDKETISVEMYANSFGFVLTKNENASISSSIHNNTLTFNIDEPHGFALGNNSQITLNIPKDKNDLNLNLKNLNATTTINSDVEINNLSYKTTNGDFNFKKGKVNGQLSLDLGRSTFNLSNAVKTNTNNVQLKMTTGMFKAKELILGNISVLQNKRGVISVTECKNLVANIASAGGQFSVDKIGYVNILTSDTNLKFGEITDGADIELTGSGKVNIAEVKSISVIKTKSGNIKINKAESNLTVHSDTGNISVLSAKTLISTKTNYGDIEIYFSEDAESYLNNSNARCLIARLSNGKLTATGVEHLGLVENDEGIKVSKNGRVNIVMNNVYGENEIIGENGSVRVVVDKDNVFELTTSSKANDVRVNLTQTIEYNGYTTKEILTTPVNCESSEHKLKVSTNNGSLRVFDTNFA